MAFAGFSTDNLVGLPPELFSDVIPNITLPSELKVTLQIFYRLSRQRIRPRRLSWDELVADQMLQRSLRSISTLRPYEELLAEGIDAALRRRTLLHLTLPADGRVGNWYLVNTTANQVWVQRLGAAQLALSPPSELVERSSLLSLYEQNIGLVTPMLVEELREAEERYPRLWIEEAMREAVRANARSWRYIRKVLERWAAHGRPHAPDQPERPIDVDKYTSGQFGGLFRRGSDESEL